MPIRLVTGPVGSGKTSYLLDVLNDTLQKEPTLYVTPSEYIAAELRHHVLTQNKKTLLGDVFISWNHFLRLMAGAAQPTIPSVHLNLFIYQLLKTHSLRYFRPQNVSMGIAREFVNTIITLKQNLIDPATLRHELETKGSLKENDLLTLYERYEKERVRHGIIDEGDLPLIALSNIKKGKLDNLSEIKSIMIDEFYTFSPGLRTLLVELSKQFTKKEVWLTHPTTEITDAPYAALWNDSSESISSFARSHEKLKCVSSPQPTVDAYSVRSPTMEARFIARSIANQIDKDDGKRTAVIIRTGDNFISNILDESETHGLLKNRSLIGTSMDSPLPHRLLSNEVLAHLDHEGTIDQLSRQLTDSLMQLNPLGRCGEDVSKPELRSVVSKNLCALGNIDHMLRSLTTKAKLFGLEKISRRSFVELLHHSLDGQSSWNSLETALAFSVRPFESPPSRPIATSFIPRLIDGHIPQTVTERLFFGDIDNFLDIFKGPEEQLAREAALFHAALKKTADRVVLSLPLIDHSGSETIPSSFLDDLTRIIPVDVPPEISKDKKSHAFERRLIDSIKIERERFRGDATHPAYHGIINDPAIKEMIRSRFSKTMFSPTSLERYAECPFQFFVEKVLNLKPEEEITPEIQPKDRGTIIHSLLERFYRDRLDNFRRAIGNPKDEHEIEDIVNELVDRVFVEHASLIGYASPSLDAYQRRAVKTLAMQVIKMEISGAREVPDPLLPARCEWCFGEGDQPSLDIPIQGEPPARIKGRIDRIDLTDDRKRFAVIDYKTGGHVDAVKNNISKGLHLQLPIYVEAVHRILLKDTEPLGGLLIGVQQSEKKHGFLKKSFNDVNYSLGKRLSTLLSDDAWDELLSSALEYAATYVIQIRDGSFPARPHKCSDYCDYKDICRHHEEID